MAKQTKKAKRTKPGLARKLPAPPPSQEDFKRARDLLRKRADALILDRAKRYQAGKAAELTAVLDAMDSLSELERMHWAAEGVTVAPSCAGPGDPSAEGGASPPPTASRISFIADRAAGAEAPTASGTVKWLNPQKGFGFIMHAETGNNVFVHISAVEKAGLTKVKVIRQPTRPALAITQRPELLRFGIAA